MKLSELGCNYPYLESVTKTYPDIKVMVDTERGLEDIETLGEAVDIHIHRDFRVRWVSLMKGYSGDYDEQEYKFKSGVPHESEFWVYKEETQRYYKDQVIRSDKAIIF